MPVLPVYSDGFSYAALPPGYGVATSRNGSPLHDGWQPHEVGMHRLPRSFVRHDRRADAHSRPAAHPHTRLRARSLRRRRRPRSCACPSSHRGASALARCRSRPSISDSGTMTSPAPVSDDHVTCTPTSGRCAASRSCNDHRLGKLRSRDRVLSVTGGNLEQRRRRSRAVAACPDDQQRGRHQNESRRARAVVRARELR